MIYISLSECDKSHKAQHDTAHSLLSSLLLELGYNDPVILKKENGRPYVNFECTDISITHSKNLVAVGVSSEKDIETDCTLPIPVKAQKIGIDIEYIDKNIDLNQKNRLAKRFFSKEASSIDEFFRIWTENEAVGKLTGEGVIQKQAAICNVISFTVILENSKDEYSLSIAYSD